MLLKLFLTVTYGICFNKRINYVFLYNRSKQKKHSLQRYFKRAQSCWRAGICFYLDILVNMNLSGPQSDRDLFWHKGQTVKATAHEESVSHAW